MNISNITEEDKKIIDLSDYKEVEYDSTAITGSDNPENN